MSGLLKRMILAHPVWARRFGRPRPAHVSPKQCLVRCLSGACIAHAVPASRLADRCRPGPCLHSPCPCVKFGQSGCRAPLVKRASYSRTSPRMDHFSSFAHPGNSRGQAQAPSRTVMQKATSSLPDIIEVPGGFACRKIRSIADMKKCFHQATTSQASQAGRRQWAVRPLAIRPCMSRISMFLSPRLLMIRGCSLAYPENANPSGLTPRTSGPRVDAQYRYFSIPIPSPRS